MCYSTVNFARSLHFELAPNSPPRQSLVSARSLCSSPRQSTMLSCPFHFESKPALVAYVTCGDPDIATTREVILAAIEAGASIIELGVPFSDPLADGPVIQRASERALKQGTSLEHVLKLAAEIREHSQSVGLVVFSYLNPILRMGLAKFCHVARPPESMAPSSPISPSKNRPNTCARRARTTSPQSSSLRLRRPTSA
jgi:hypothetical protein